MKTEIKKLNRLMKVIDMDDFYAIRIATGVIDLQGKFTPELVIKYKSFDFKLDEFINGSRYNINIILT